MRHTRTHASKQQSPPTCGRCVTASTCPTRRPEPGAAMRRRMRPTVWPSREPMPESISSSTNTWLAPPPAASSPAAAAASSPVAAAAAPPASSPPPPLPPASGGVGRKAGAALSASMMRADSPPDATADSGRSGSPCPAANRNSTASRPLGRTRYRPPASPQPAACSAASAMLPPARSPLPKVLLLLLPAAADSGVQLMRTSNWLPPMARSASTASTAARSCPAASRRRRLRAGGRGAAQGGGRA